MGLFSRGGGGGQAPVPPETAAAAAEAEAAEDGVAPAAAASGARARSSTPSPLPPPPADGGGATAEFVTPTKQRPNNNPLHRRSAESPLVGGFFHPLRPLGPSHLAEARAHAFAARARDPDRAAEGAALDPLLRGMADDNEEHVDAHHAQTRVSRRAEDMMLQRLDDLEHDALAHEPVPEDKAEGKARPWRSALRNLPVLLVMVGMLVVVLLGKSRLHVPEPLQAVHGVTSAEPYFLPLEADSVDYLFVLATAAPWYGFSPPGSEVGGGSGGGGHRRRRSLLMSGGGEAAAAAGEEVLKAGEVLQRAWAAVGNDPRAAEADEAWRSAALAALRAGKRAGEAQRRAVRRKGGSVGAVAAALSHVLELDGGAPEAAAGHPLSSTSRRRLTAAAPAAATGQTQPMPRLVVQLVEKLAAPPPPLPAASKNKSTTATVPDDSTALATTLPTLVIGPQGYGFAPVAPPQYCALKQGAANRCTLSFTNARAGAGAKPGSPLFLALSLDNPGATAVELHAREVGWLGRAKIWFALAILVVMLVGIATEKVHRVWCAVLASFAMLGLLIWLDMAPDLSTVVSWMDESTICLLFGMMLIIGKLAQTGAFEVVTASTLQLARGNMAVLTIALLSVTALVSAFLDNVTTILLVGPMTISLVKSMGQDPRPMFIAQVLASNIGGAATLVGDPPNIIIGTSLGRYIGFVDFLIHMAPGAVLAFIACLPLILVLFRSSLLGRIPNYEKVLEMGKQYRITNWSLFWKCVYVLGIVLLGFLLHPLHHLDPGWFALFGGTVLCVASDRQEVEEVLHLVELDTLLFLAALFIVVEAAAQVGLIDAIGGIFALLFGATTLAARRAVAVTVILWVSAIASALLDNVPYTIAMVPVIEFLAYGNLGLPLPLMAWALGFGACLGGNGSLIAASVNIVGASMLDRAGHAMSFKRWLKAGVPVTVVSVAVVNAYMLLRYCLPGSSEYPMTPIV